MASLHTGSMGSVAKYPDLQGKRVFVTGGSQGIGAATSQAFCQNGASVAVMGRDAKKLQSFASSLPQGKGFATPGDLTDIASCRNAVKEAMKHLGGLDIIVHCGSAHNEGMLKQPDSAEAMLAGFQLHVASAAAVIQEGIEELLKNKGAVVTVSSAHSIVPFPDVPAYTVAKAAQDALTQTWALKYGPKGVRFNSIRPGCVDTEGLRDFTESSGESWDDAAKVMKGSHALARIGHPEEQAAAILFLASNASSFITGENLNTDGGAHLGFWLNRESIPQ